MCQHSGLLLSGQPAYDQALHLFAYPGRNCALKRLSIFIFCLFSICVLAQQPGESPQPRISIIAAAPSTAKRPVRDEYQDGKVVDDYRWLESDNDTEDRTWLEAQNTRMHVYLDYLRQEAEV